MSQNKVPEVTTFHLTMSLEGGTLGVYYVPYAGKSANQGLAGQIIFGPGAGTENQQRLHSQFERLQALLASRAPTTRFRLGDQLVERKAYAKRFHIFHDRGAGRVQIDWAYGDGGTGTAGESIPEEELAEGQAALFGNIISAAKQVCWDELRRRLDLPEVQTTRSQVFVSYRNGYQKFAEAVAQRLGVEGFVPWFDVWDVIPGDSVTGQLNEGLDKSVAFVCVLTKNYPAGKWATEELRTAIHNRVERGLRIVPILLEDCEKPPLIRDISHVDFRDHDATTFEQRMGDVIDGINRLGKNPFRR